jgi:hypothetical protein
LELLKENGWKCYEVEFHTAHFFSNCFIDYESHRKAVSLIKDHKAQISVTGLCDTDEIKNIIKSFNEVKEVNVHYAHDITLFKSIEILDLTFTQSRVSLKMPPISLKKLRLHFKSLYIGFRIGYIDLREADCDHICIKFYNGVHREDEVGIFKEIGKNSPSSLSIHYINIKDVSSIDNQGYLDAISYLKGIPYKIFIREADRKPDFLECFANVVSHQSKRSEERYALDRAYQRSIRDLDTKRKYNLLNHRTK